MFCTKCGQENDDDAKFCKKCGSPLESLDDEVLEDGNSINENSQDNEFNGTDITSSVKPKIKARYFNKKYLRNNQNSKTKGSRLSLKIIISIAIIFLVLLAGVFIIFTNDSEENSVDGLQNSETLVLALIIS